jgi:hypothetical protein
MSRFLEGVFVLGACLVGLAMNSPAGSNLQDTMNASVQLISHVEDNIAANLNCIPVRALRLRIE